ncbi:MAG: hypothetical protein K2P21_10475 [Lachnospiraceae bacterium]|nr:hypothetical protein [Lachnospiraceae bacterium]
MRMDNGLTGISNKNLSEIRRKDMTAQEIIAFLESGALYRTFRDVLSKVYKAGDLKSDLTDGLYRLGGGKRESVARNVRNWLNGTDVPRREQLFKICFVLGLDDVQASQVIASISETGIHYRNPEELIYAYCLRMGRPYEDALVLKEDLLPEILTMSGEQGEEIESVYTRQLQRAFEEQVTNDEELRAFLQANAGKLGRLHRTAHEAFVRMLDYLQSPEKGLRTFSVQEIADEFFRMHVPKNTGKRKQTVARDFSYIQKVIRRDWPSEDIIYKMKSGNVDVSRKVLLLLFLLTEEFEVSEPVDSGEEFWEEDSYLEDVDDEDENVRMEVRLNQMNLFLDSYGMNRLDVGSPFDCLVLYALKASYTGGNGGDAMSERLEKALEILFDGERG